MDIVAQIIVFCQIKIEIFFSFYFHFVELFQQKIKAKKQQERTAKVDN